MIRKLFLLSICLVIWLAVLSQNSVMNIYVSQTGKDSYEGTINRPLYSINKANEIACKHARKNAVTIYIRQGIYYLDKPLIHNANSSGTEQLPIRYTAYPKEKVIISSGYEFKNLKWELYKNGIFKTKISSENDIIFDQLFVNGILAFQARFPNYNANIRHFKGYSKDAISPEQVKKWNNPKGGYLHVMQSHEWGGYHYVITGKKDSETLLLEGGGQNNRPTGMHPNYRMVENIFEELDAENEWFFDNQEKILYYYPPQKMNIHAAVFEAPQLESIIELKGNAENPVKFIEFSGLTLTHTVRTFMKTKEPLLRSDWAIYRNGAIFIEGAENCKIDNCIIKNVGGNAVFFSNYNKNNTIYGCHIHNVGASGVAFVGSPDAVKSPSFSYGKHVPYELIDKSLGPLNNNFPSDCKVDNNLIHNLGLVEKQVAGVQISMSQGIIVSNNSIYDLPRAGINIGDGTWGGHIIEENDVFNTVLETGDHGSFNSWGRDRFWTADRSLMDSITAKYPECILLDAVETTVIRNNRWQCFHGWDIDLDDGSSNYHIYNNVCLNGGIKLREGFERTVENNIIINNSFHPHVWFRNSNDVFEHNIVTREYYPISIPDWGKRVDYNLFPHNAALEKAQSQHTDKHSLYGDPLFENPESGDYRVKNGSPALKVGFKNFDTQHFGVKVAWLKKQAKQPIVPRIISQQNKQKNTIYDWNGVKLKNMATEGERSATGMADINGILLIDIPKKSFLDKAGIKPNSVIVAYNYRKILNWEDLEKEISITDKGEIIRLTVFQNQEEKDFSVELP